MKVPPQIVPTVIQTHETATNRNTNEGRGTSSLILDMKFFSSPEERGKTEFISILYPGRSIAPNGGK